MGGGGGVAQLPPWKIHEKLKWSMCSLVEFFLLKFSTTKCSFEHFHFQIKKKNPPITTSQHLKSVKVQF